MQAQGQFVTLRDGSGAKAVIAPELGAWLLRYTRHLPDLGYVEGLHFSQEVVARYPNQMYAGNPLLFPQVSYSHLPGREHHYNHAGKVYSLPQHGFARRSKWKVINVNEANVAMQLVDSPETRTSYPFPFRIEVTYELRDGQLHFRQVVENPGTEPLIFSTGIHPYFPVPIMPGRQRNNCYVELPAARRVIPKGDWESWTSEVFDAQRLSVSQDVSGTLFLADLATPEISLVDPTGGIKITLNFAQAPQHRYVALWSKSTSEPYYCVEPWTALPNSLNRKDSELIRLAPGAHFEANIWMNISRV
jgi:aldose 1-epimerase